MSTSHQIDLLTEIALSRLSEDYRWRDAELRGIRALLLRKPIPNVVKKVAVLTAYAHWEGFFKRCGEVAAEDIKNKIDKKYFGFSSLNENVRLRVIICYHQGGGVNEENGMRFLESLRAIDEPRTSRYFSDSSRIVLTGSNLNYERAVAICRNLGVNWDWFGGKKIQIDEQLLALRNAIAHGDHLLRSGGLVDDSLEEVEQTFENTVGLIRACKTAFENCIVQRGYLARVVN